MSARTNLVRRVTHPRPVIVLEEQAANDAWASRQLGKVLAQLPTPCFLPPTPRHVLDKKLARVTLARMRAARLGGGDLPFWKATNYAEALLRSALSAHVRSRGR